MRERILLAVVVFDGRNPWTPQDEEREMSDLIRSCGGQVVQVVVCKTVPPTASHLLTKGKVDEIAALTAQGGIDAVIVTCELKGSQQRNLEEAFGVKTLDRTQLILDIFARHATSMEGRLQVELAQLQYMLPRLVGSADALSRQGGGIGTSGPGETKLEVDRRRIGARISKLKSQLKEVTQSRAIKRKKRKEGEIPTVALVGYTNTGKSSLLNALTDAGAVTHDGLFTTLDSLSRQTLLPNHRKVVFSDTVGFMHDLPHGLIEAFKATLEEVQHADVLLHVMDISHHNYQQFYAAVNDVLDQLKCLDKPTILVLNKIDQGDDPRRLKEFNSKHDHVIAISAKTGQNIQQLMLTVEEVLSMGSVDVNVILPADRMDLVNLAYAQGHVQEVKYLSKGIRLKATLPAKTAALLARV